MIELIDWIANKYAARTGAMHPIFYKIILVMFLIKNGLAFLHRRIENYRWKESNSFIIINMIMSVTLIPAEKLIIFFDEMCNEFFNDDRMQYLMFGKVSAKYALSPEGPYKSYMLTKDIKQFVEVYMPKLWTAFFDGGITTARLENNIVHLKVTGINIKNLYFEQLVMGYNQQALKTFGKKSVAKKVRSISSGDEDIYFQFELKDS